jgi:hypothetical protein
MSNQESNDFTKSKKKNTISLKTAKKWAKEWRDDEASYNKYFECKAFNIPKIDLIEVLAEDGVESVRAYLGVEKTPVKGGQPIFAEKLMIVGVDKNGKDMISVSKDNSEVLDSEDGDIYDFTSSCPDLCDEDSPLND